MNGGGRGNPFPPSPYGGERMANNAIQTYAMRSQPQAGDTTADGATAATCRDKGGGVAQAIHGTIIGCDAHIGTASGGGGDGGDNAGGGAVCGASKEADLVGGE